MAAAPISTTDRRRGAPSLEAARAALQRELDPRYVQFPSFAHQAGSEPLVVPLGADDPLGDVAADPYAMVRSRATLHLTDRAVLVGPWGGEEREPAACGLCLGLHWQGLRGGPEARAWGHGAPDDAERPDLAQEVTDVVRTVWSAVFDADEPGDPATADAADVPGVPATAGEGPPRVTCVDLRIPVPRTYLLLPEPPCGLHTGCRG